VAYCDEGRTAVVVYLPEFNGDWTVYGPEGHPTWGAEPADFKTAYRNFVQRGRAMGLGPDKVKWCWAPNNVGWGTLAEWWPGDDVVDVVGGSAYNWGGLYPGYEWQTPAELFGSYAAEVRAFTALPIIVTQTAAGLDDPQTPEWLDQAVQFCADPASPVGGFLWFNIGEFRFGPGADDYNARTAGMDSTRPDDWFKEDVMPERFPGATWVGSKMPGKAWVGTTRPKLVLHTLEFLAWPDPQRWDAPAHLVCNPSTGEVRQYLPMDKSAYAVRDNALEDDRPTWQVELWGSARNVPTYSDVWYRGLAQLIQMFHQVYDIPLTFADFTNVQYGKYAPQRMSDAEVRAFHGVLGHCHMGLGQDDHWDPGKLDVTRVLQFLGGVHPPPPTDEGDYEMQTVRRGDGYLATADKKPAVGAWQSLLAYHGHADQNTSDGSGCAIDRIFGPGTEQATVEFQRGRGIADDGVVGPVTWAAGEQA